jgi:hypothetical protein
MQHVAEIKPLPVSESTFADLLKPLIEPGFRLALVERQDALAIHRWRPKRTLRLLWLADRWGLIHPKVRLQRGPYLRVLDSRMPFAQ